MSDGRKTKSRDDSGKDFGTPQRQRNCCTGATLTIEQISIAIRDEYAAYEVAMSDAVARAKKIGDLLIAAKRLLPHGEFRPWIKENTGLSYTTAHRFVVIAKNWEAVRAKDFALKRLDDAHAVARGRDPVPSEKRGHSIGRLLNILEEKIAELVLDHPEIADIVDEIAKWKSRLESIDCLIKKPGRCKFPDATAEKVKKAYDHGYKTIDIFKELKSSGADVSYEWVKAVCHGRIRTSKNQQQLITT